MTCEFEDCGLPRGLIGLEGEGYRIEFRNLKIKEDSYKKLHNARLAPQQEMILSLVDGNRTIYEICRLTGVLEFEVYKFLYLMGKARIVSPVNPDSTSSTI